MAVVARLSAKPKIFSASRIDALRARARRLSRLPEQPASGWICNTSDPHQMLALFPPLRLRDDYALRGWQNVSGLDAKGEVRVIAAGTSPDRDASDPRFACYLRGDDTARSYLYASILVRELLEFGSVRHGCWWAYERLVSAAPRDVPWTWLEEAPANLAPQVKLTDEAAIVTFCTHTVLGRERLTRYIDIYERGKYTFATEGCVIAAR